MVNDPFSQGDAPVAISIHLLVSFDEIVPEQAIISEPRISHQVVVDHFIEYDASISTYVHSSEPTNDSVPP